jgi:predicted  nucleic acid-binding Zn-ribbon protein
MITLEELRTADTERKKLINSSLQDIETLLEETLTKSVEYIQNIDELSRSITSLEKERDQLIRDNNVAKLSQEREKVAYNDLITQLETRIGKMRSSITNLEEDYKKAFERRQAVDDELADTRTELEQWESSLRVKTEAFKQEKQEFYAERRRIQGARSV